MSALVPILQRLSGEVDRLYFVPPVTHVYNPLDYAWDAHRAYLELYGIGRKRIVLLGMNPGPFGMAQTGVPFGDIESVRGWLGIETAVGKPKNEHPKRPVLGFDCSRREVSGSRLWGWAAQRFGTPDRFFADFFVHNYCPLCFMEDTGRNRTPDKLPAAERDPLFAACDDALRKLAAALEPEYLLGVGAFAEARIRAALPDFPGALGRIPHPSPANPAANQGWAEEAEKALAGLGVVLPAR